MSQRAPLIDPKAGGRPAPVNPLEDPRWDERIAAHPESTFFHGSAWARVLIDTYSFRPMYFVRDDGAGHYDVLPMMEVDSWLTGRRGVALPFTDRCDPLVSSPAAFEELAQAAADAARSRRWKSYEVRGGRNWTPHATVSTAFLGHTLDLTCGEAALFARADSATRRAVRKAEKSSVTISISQSLEALTDFYALLCLTRRRHGLPPQPFRFFSNISQHIISRGLGCVALAFHEGTPIAGAVFFHQGKSVLYKFGASDDTFQHLRGNNLVMWRAIESFARNGFETLDFGRTSMGNEGLRAYKLAWGSTEHRVEYTKYDCRQNAYVSEPDRASGHWHNRVFRLLPPVASRLAGALLYKHIA